MWWPVTHAVIVTLTSLSDGRSARDIPKQHRSIKMGSLQQMAFGSQKVLWNVPKKFFALVSQSFAEFWTNGYCFRKGSVEGSANYSLLYLSPILMLGWKLRELFQYKSSLQKTIHHVVAVGVFFVEHKQSNGSVISCHWHCWLFRNHKANYLGCNRNHVNHVIFTISTCAVFVHQQSECQRRTKNGDILNISLRKSLVSGGWPSKRGHLGSSKYTKIHWCFIGAHLGGRCSSPPPDHVQWAPRSAARRGLGGGRDDPLVNQHGNWKCPFFYRRYIFKWWISHLQRWDVGCVTVDGRNPAPPGMVETL